MQAEENKNLKQHVHTFNEENNSLKNLVGVLEADVAKLDDLEAKVDQMTQLYQKEKDLNQQLLSSAQTNAEDDDTGDDDEEGKGVANPTVGVKVSGEVTEQIFRQKFEAEQELCLKLQEELRDMKTQLNHSEALTEQQIKLKEKASQQFKEQQNLNAEMGKRVEAINGELNNRDGHIQQL